MKFRSVTAAKIILSGIALASVVLTTAHAEAMRNTGEYNLQGTLGLKGYDPVATFSEGGGVPTMGNASLKFEYLGVTYHFSTPANLDAFKSNPNKYEPTYGGWCAYAMASGSKVDIQPHLFTLHGNRAHYFVSARAKQNFDRDVAGYESRADGFWKQIAGEDPRL